MKKLFFLVGLIFFSEFSFAQVPYLWLTKTDTTGKVFSGIIDVQGNATVGSNFLTKEFVQPFIVGGKITSEMKRSVINEMSDLGLFGGNGNVCLRYYGGRDSLFGSEMLD